MTQSPSALTMLLSRHTRRRRLGEEMKFCSVSPRVGNVKNKDPTLIETVLVQ